MAGDLINDDEALHDAIRRVSGGETAAFEVILRRFELPLRAWLSTQAPPSVDVDEIAQQSFVTAFLELKRFQPGTDFQAWLFTVARYQLKTELTRLRRKADYHRRLAPELLQRELDRMSNEPVELQQMRLDHLSNCLDQLGDHLRRFITWRYEEEVSIKEMSSRSGHSVASVKKRLWHLRRKLSECIERRIAIERGTP